MTRVLVLSDLHVFSNVGLCLPEVYDVDSKLLYVSNAVQKHYFEQWCNMIRRVGKVDILILNGDLVEGENFKERGLGVVSTNMHTQSVVAATLIKMIDAKVIYVSNGSKYHTGQTSSDQTVCDMVDGIWVGDHHFLTVEGIVIHFRHKSGHSSIPYSRYTSGRREALIQKAQGTNVDIYIRSHTHHFGFSGDSNDITVNTPCWKGLDHYINQGSQEMPDNGYVFFDIDGANYKWDYHIFKVPYNMYGVCTTYDCNQQ